eukprot:COSAG01_NODE_497_length_16267_cov_5.357558_13_plen_122_part_00
MSCHATGGAWGHNAQRAPGRRRWFCVLIAAVPQSTIVAYNVSPQQWHGLQLRLPRGPPPSLGIRRPGRRGLRAPWPEHQATAAPGRVVQRELARQEAAMLEAIGMQLLLSSSCFHHEGPAE